MFYLWKWLFIAIFLFILTFGFKACLISILSTLACLSGVLLSVYSRRKKYIDVSMRNYVSSYSGDVILLPGSAHLSQGLISAQISINPISKSHKHDKRLTGSIIIDEPLQEVLFYAFRDYIYAWYHQLSGNEDFPFHIRETVQQVIIACSNRSKEVEWVHYATTRLVDDFASHLRLFRKAQAKLKEEKQNSAPTSGEGNSPVPKSNLLSYFFQMETTMERNLCRDLVCTTTSHLNTYLQDLTQVLLYLVFPPEDFNNKALRFFIREILVNCVLLPMISLFSDPDYINQIIVWLCKESLPTPEAFLMVLRSTDSLDELQAVKDRVSHEIAILRSKDTGGDFDAEIKQQLSSLVYVKKAVDARIRRLQEGNLDTDSSGMPSEIDWKKLTEPGTRLFMLPFDVVLTNNIALHYFIEFMTNKNAQGLVFFYHAIEGYKVSAEQQLSSVHLARISKSTEQSPSSSPSVSSSSPPNICPTVDLEGLRDAAQHIYELFLSEKASLRVKLEDVLLKKLMTKLKSEKPNETWFEEVQARVYEMMQEDQYLGSFRRSPGYVKLLAELDLLKDPGGRSDEEEISFGSKSGVKNPSDDGSLSQFDTLSLSSLEPDDDGGSIGSGERMTDMDATQAIEEINHEDFIITATIYNTGIMHNNGSQYAVYAISVVIQRISTGGTEKWCIVRRYSDFHSFHLALMEKFPSLSTVVQFPGKKTFNNLSRQFLEKRTALLNTYLQTLLSHHTLSSHKGLQATIFHFLEPGMYDTRQRRQFSKAMGTLVSPLKHSMKSVGERVKTMPDILFDGIKDGLVKVLGGGGNSGVAKLLPGALNPAGFPIGISEKVAAGLDIEGDDNIPLRIVLLLMDEVFDLKSKDQWFRRRIVVLLRQIIKATYGDTINRKILDYVGWLTSAEQFSEYVKSFRQSFWPNGSMALPQPERDNNTRMRTRVAAKMVLLSSIPDELKHVIGSETTRKGVLSIFEMFQQRELNRRLLLVLMEGILEILFPDNYLPELFRRLHSASPHTTDEPILKHKRNDSSQSGDGLVSLSGDNSSTKLFNVQSDAFQSVKETSSKNSQR